MEIYVSGIPYDITEEKVREIFAAYGEVGRIGLPRDRLSDQGRGFCFVTMPDAVAAGNAIAALNGTELEGRKLRVTESRSSKTGEKR